MKIKNQNKIHDGIILDLYQAQVETETGSFPVEILKHPGAVCVAATPNGTDFFMVEQFRFGLGQDVLEFPAGKIDNPDEDPILTAHRELQEETGYEASNMIYLGLMHPAPAYIDEVIHLYLATDLIYRGQNLDEHETLKVSTYSLNQILKMIDDQTITDAKTIILAHKVHQYLFK